MLIAIWILAAIHVLSGAVWFGAMFYSLTVVHPRARSFFHRRSDFEEFIAFLASGARWKVLGLCASLAITGISLWLLCPAKHVSFAWNLCLGIKSILFILAICIFCYASWVLWPARVLAGEEEISGLQKKFHILGFTLLVIIGVIMVVSVLSAKL